MNDPQPRPATAEEISAALESSLAELRSNAPQLFSGVTTQAEALERMGEFLDMLQQHCYAPAGQRAALTIREMRTFSVFFPAILAIVKTMQHNPLWGTRALYDQLTHNFETIINLGRPMSGLIWEKSKGDKTP